MATTWININKVIKDKDLIAKHMDWINVLISAMPDKIKREPYGKTERILVNSDFAEDFEQRFWGWTHDKSDIVNMKYGIPYETITKECKRLYKSHPEIVNYSPTRNIFAIIDPKAFMETAGLSAIKPFADRNWVTAKQLTIKLYNPKDPDQLLSPTYIPYYVRRKDFLADVLDMLKEFALAHPDAVYINKRGYTEYTDKFDPTRIKREYIPEFERQFGLRTVSISKLKAATKIKDEDKLKDMLAGFSYLADDDAVVTKSGSRALREKYLPQFLEYVKRQQEKEEEKQKEQYLAEQRAKTLSPQRISDIIVSKCRHSLASIAKKMRDFAKQHPDAVVLQEDYHFVGVYPEYLNEFIDFAGMQLRETPKEMPAKQLEIDPNLPGYPSAPDLEPISDEKMDAIAWSLASKRLKRSPMRANDMIFAEWMKKRKKENS